MIDQHGTVVVIYHIVDGHAARTVREIIIADDCGQLSVRITQKGIVRINGSVIVRDLLIDLNVEVDVIFPEIGFPRGEVFFQIFRISSPVS